MTPEAERSTVHLYRRHHQPATRYVVEIGYGKRNRLWVRCGPRQRVRTSCCRKLRWAKHCTVQVYYDMVPFWCRPGHGCKA